MDEPLPTPLPKARVLVAQVPPSQSSVPSPSGPTPPSHMAPDRHPPFVAILHPQDGQKTFEGKAKVLVVAFDDVKVERVLIKGKEARRLPSPPRGIEVLPKPPFEPRDKVYFEREVDLLPGMNYIQAEAIDSSGKRGKSKLVRVAMLPTEEAPEKLTLWVLAVGISNYKDERIPDLKFASNDAKALYKFFLELKHRGVFKDVRMRLLVDEEATRANITEALGYFLRMASPEDTVVIFFAGHGGVEGGEHYFMAYDTDPKNLFGTGVSQTAFERALRRIKAKRVVMLMDCCYSEGLLQVALVPRGEVEEVRRKFWEEVTRAEGRVAICSSTSEEVSFEKEGHGVFTYYLLKALRGEADRDGNGVITVNEAYAYVYRKVVEETEGRQRPTKVEGRMVGQIPLSVVE